MSNILKAEGLKDLTKAELNEKLFSLKKELFELRGQARVGKLEKSTQMRLVRRNIARVKTVLNQGQNNEPVKK